MKAQNTKCIILGHRDYGEFNKLIFIYSQEYGKLKLVAKGARKITSKFTGHLETLNFCATSIYFGPKSNILTEIETIRSNKSIRTNLSKLKIALQIAEITDRLVYENQHVKGLMELLNETLEQLSISKKDSLVIYSYIIKLLDKTGNLPDLKHFQEDKYLKFFHYLQNNTLKEIERITLSEEEEYNIRKKLINAVELQTDREIKSFFI
jgi:DNA repair protein RecO (recombination protein O)